MTPAIDVLQKAKVKYLLHQYEHDPRASSYGLEAAEKLGFDPQQVYKTLVVSLDGGGLGVAVIPVDEKLNLKAAAAAFKVKKVALAPAAAVSRATGYVLGGVSPLGQKKRLPTVLAAAAATRATILVSGGRRGLDLELAPAALQSLTDAVYAPLT
ncbi:MAG: Cys-tRNA(Pro) deacylase [Deltaproteobacteria bacterium]|nr:Cys-tRNA(Pro) deacylase [Deltaproteobacteria bacterium]